MLYKEQSCIPIQIHVYDYTYTWAVFCFSKKTAFKLLNISTAFKKTLTHLKISNQESIQYIYIYIFFIRFYRCQDNISYCHLLMIRKPSHPLWSSSLSRQGFQSQCPKLDLRQVVSRSNTLYLLSMSASSFDLPIIYMCR